MDWDKAKGAMRRKLLNSLKLRSREELLDLVEKADFLKHQEKAFIAAAAKFSELKLVDLMTPANTISFVRDKVELTPKVIDQLYSTGQKVFPIVHTDLSDCIGLIFLEEIAEVAKGDQSLKDAAHERPPVAKETTPILEILDLLFERNYQVALIENQGKISGMIELPTLLSHLLGRDVV
jgi:CBS domain containing-hemolysin-like protein